MRIIAEAGINHNGSLQRALWMVRVAKECGAETIKFQHIDPMHFKSDLMWQGYNMRELFEKVRFSKEDLHTIMDECVIHKIDFLCTPQTVQDFEYLLELGIKEVKISSDNLGNTELLKRVAKSGLPAIFSTGMATHDDIFNARWNYFRGKKATAMICTSEYPCPPEGVNVERCAMINPPVGFSDHTVGTTAAVMALALGATVFEKHFTLDHSMEGPDHSWSADPKELKEYVDTLRTAELMLGSGEFKPTEKELELKKLLEA